MDAACSGGVCKSSVLQHTLCFLFCKGSRDQSEVSLCSNHSWWKGRESCAVQGRYWSVCALLLGFPCLASALLGFVWSFAVTRGLSSILVLGQGCGYRTRGCSPVRLGPAELNPSKLSNAQISELGAEALWDSPHPSASSLL